MSVFIYVVYGCSYLIITLLYFCMFVDVVVFFLFLLLLLVLGVFCCFLCGVFCVNLWSFEGCWFLFEFLFEFLYYV